MTGTGIWGADVEALASLASTMTRACRQLAALERQMAAGVEALGPVWQGPDADAFLARWRTTYRPGVLRAGDALGAAAGQIDRNRRQQIEASSAAAASGPVLYQGGPVPGPGGAGPGLGPSLTPEQLAAMTPAEVQAWYRNRALGLLGTTDAAWRPEAGFDANQEVVAGVVDVYGDFYRTDPDTYLWAGMASMIWGSLYAGVEDLGDAQTAGEILERIGEIERLVPGGTVLGPLTELSGQELADEARWYQTRLLQMQKEVFLDQAAAHEAYRDGGLPAVEKLLADDPYGRGPETLRAWRLIDEGRRTGNPDLVAQGSQQLLYREQRWVLQDDYDAMRSHHGPVGEAMTYLMTTTGSPSIPGAASYADLHPVTVGTGVRIPVPFAPDIEVGARLETPLPDGNIADFDDRWGLITDDTLPAYLQLAEQPDDVLAVIDVPVTQRADDYRIVNQLDDIIGRFDVDVSVGTAG